MMILNVIGQNPMLLFFFSVLVYFVWRGALSERANIPNVENLALNEDLFLWKSYIRYFWQKASHE